MAPASTPEESTSSFSFVSDEEVAKMNQPQEQVPQQDATPVATEEPAQGDIEQPVETDQQEYAEPSTTTEPSPEEVESAVIDFLSNRLGRDINSIDDLMDAQQTEAPALDERISAIAKFVAETGRAPEDWFRYQSLNPEGMDDMTAIQIEMANNYPNLSYEELGLLIGSKYKIDPDVHTDDEIRLSQLQMKIDGDKAKSEINRMRDSYSAPKESEPALQQESIINDDWIAKMSSEVDSLTGLEFDLGGDKTFEFGLDDQYKTQLKSKNARLDEYFDEYVNQDGTWDYDKLSSHRAVVDNVDRIVKAAYTRGLGDGQKDLLNTAANVTTDTPRQTQNNGPDPLTQQLKEALGVNKGGFGFI